MCIIAVKPAGVPATLKKQTVDYCAIANPHGIGYAHLSAGEKTIQIKKGVTVDELYSYITKNVNTNDIFIAHFRYATHGLIDAGNCHPFPVSEDRKKLRQTELTAPLVCAHNGVIRDFYDSAGKYSDTQEFIASILAAPHIIGNITHPATQKLIDCMLGGDRLVVLDAASRDLLMFGEWSVDSISKWHFSNSGYRASASFFKPAKKPKETSASFGSRSCDFCQSFDKVKYAPQYEAYLCAECLDTERRYTRQYDIPRWLQ